MAIEIGPILPRYMQTIMISRPMVFRFDVRSMERPTVARLLITSNRAS